MLNAVAGASALEILVQLRDLSQAGLLNLQRNIATTEARVNAINFGGFSRASKTLATDAEQAAGKTGGGGLMSLIGGFVGLPGPLAIAGVAVAGFAALSATTIPVYEKVKQQEDQLAVAFKDHGESLDKLRPQLESAIKVGEGYAFTADQTRAAVIKLTEAGMSFTDIQTNLPRIMDLARAKNLDLAEAARMYELALMGNTRGLKDLGIALPKVTDAAKAQESATNAVTAAQAHLDAAQQHLTDVEQLLSGKHKLTAAEAIRLRDAHAAVDDASQKLKAAQTALGNVQDTAANKAARQTLINDALKKSLAGQSGTATDLQKAQAKLSDAWEKFSVVVAPVLVKALSAIVTALATVVTWISDAVDWFGKLFTQSDKWKKDHPTAASMSAAQLNTAYHTGALRGSGGPVIPGGSYIVGDTGPERLTLGPGGIGMVTPLGGSVAVGGSASVGGRQSIIHHTSIVQLDGREIARQVDRYLHRSLVDAGTGIRRPLGG